MCRLHSASLSPPSISRTGGGWRTAAHFSDSRVIKPLCVAKPCQWDAPVWSRVVGAAQGISKLSRCGCLHGLATSWVWGGDACGKTRQRFLPTKSLVWLRIRSPVVPSGAPISSPSHLHGFMSTQLLALNPLLLEISRMSSTAYNKPWLICALLLEPKLPKIMRLNSWTDLRLVLGRASLAEGKWGWGDVI